MQIIKHIESFSTSFNNLGVSILTFVQILGLTGYLAYDFGDISNKELPAGKINEALLEKAKNEYFQSADDIWKEGVPSMSGSTLLKSYFKSVNRAHDDILSHYGIINTLEDYLVYAGSSQKHMNNSDKEEQEKQQLIFSRKIASIKFLIDQESSIKPFRELPDDQRMVMESLNHSIDNNNKKSSKSNIIQLKDLLIQVNSDLKMYENSSIILLIISISGTFISLYFAVLIFNKSKQTKTTVDWKD